MAVDKAIRETFSEILSLIKSKESFLITTHIHPDGDSISSVLIFAEILKKYEKKWTICLTDSVPGKFDYLENVESIVQMDDTALPFEPEVAVVLDSASLDRIGKVRTLIGEHVEIINVDHHPSNCGYGKINCVLNDRSSTAEVAYALSRFCDVPLSKKIAEYVYTGIVCDTGRFLFPNTTQESMELCAEMIRAGARPDYIADKLYFRMSPATIRALSHALSTLEFHFNGKISCMVLANGQMPDHSVVDTEGFVDHLLAIDGTEVEFFMMEKEPGLFKVSFRSKDYIDVNMIAQTLGGGGHKRASGCTMKGELQEIKQRILETIEPHLKTN